MSSADRGDKRGRAECPTRGLPNIAHLLERARSQLDVGELLAAPSFDLQTAMSAREIGDPKMDRCSAPGVDTRSCAERIAAGEGRLDLTDAEVLAVMDRLVQMEAAWHDRYLLCQTVYTSLYVSSVGRTRAPMPDLHAYCLSVDVLCAFLYDAVYSNRVCSDECVSVVLCGVQLSNYGPDDAIEVLEDRIRDGKRDGGPVETAVVGRLKWRCDTIKALLEMARATTKANLEDVVRLCGDAIESLRDIEFLDDDAAQRAEGFVPSLYYASWRHAPMRDVTLRSMGDAVASWSSLLHSLKEAASLLANVHSWRSLKSFLDHIAARDYHGFVRCLVNYLLNRPNAPWAPTEEMLAASILLLDADGHGDHRHHHHDHHHDHHRSRDPRHERYALMIDAQPDLGTFFEECVLAVRSLCHVKCLNRPRQHRRLRHAVLEWRHMMEHAYVTEKAPEYRTWIEGQGFSWDASDQSIEQLGSERIAPLTAWVTYETAWTCIEQLLLGGPLDLYQPREVSMVFWYVAYLMGVAEHAAKEHANISRAKRYTQLHPSNVHLHRADALLRGDLVEALQMSVESVCMANIAVQVLGMLPETPREFNEQHCVHEQRFGFMAALRLPRYQSHGDYLEYVRNVVDFADSDPTKLVTEARNYALLARIALEAVRTKSLEPLVHEEMLQLVLATLEDNADALALLHRLADPADPEEASQYSVSWKFLDEKSPEGEAAMAAMTNESALSTVALSLPHLVLKREDTGNFKS